MKEVIDNPQRLTDKVVRYMLRLAEDEDIPRYPLDQEGYYRICPGPANEDVTPDVLPLVVKCRFIDAIAFAVKTKEFYGKLASSKDPAHPDNGYVERVRFIEPHYATLDEQVIHMLNNLVSFRRACERNLKRTLVRR